LIARYPGLLLLSWHPGHLLTCFIDENVVALWLYTFATLSPFLEVFVMKLTIQRLTALTPQDRIDLGKVWPDLEMEKLEQGLSESHRLYAARFNDRLLAGLQLEISGIHGKVHRLAVRDVTRRRGVGQYLLEETIRQNGSIADWWIADDGSDDQQVRAAFMQACGFRAQSDGWIRAAD
jgi:GNAT superfamily N-acetyltransferase